MSLVNRPQASAPCLRNRDNTLKGLPQQEVQWLYPLGWHMLYTQQAQFSTTGPLQLRPASPEAAPLAFRLSRDPCIGLLGPDSRLCTLLTASSTHTASDCARTQVVPSLGAPTCRPCLCSDPSVHLDSQGTQDNLEEPPLLTVPLIFPVPPPALLLPAGSLGGPPPRHLVSCGYRLLPEGDPKEGCPAVRPRWKY